MGRQMVSGSFNSARKSFCRLIKYIEPGFPLNTIRSGQLKKEALFIGDPSLIPYSEEGCGIDLIDEDNWYNSYSQHPWPP